MNLMLENILKNDELKPPSLRMVKASSEGLGIRSIPVHPSFMIGLASTLSGIRWKRQQTPYLAQEIKELEIYPKLVYIGDIRMSWTVNFTSKAAKQAGKLPKRERDILALLVRDLQLRGATLPDWHNYSKLSPTTYHCHLTYKWVACWRVEDGELKLIEIYYTGSREDAPY